MTFYNILKMYWPPHVRALILKLRPPWWIDETYETLEILDPTELVTNHDFSDEDSISDYYEDFYSALFDEDL